MSWLSSETTPRSRTGRSMCYNARYGGKIADLVVGKQYQCNAEVG